MKRHFSVHILLFFIVFGQLFAEEAILSSYERNFLRASLVEKTAILIDAATDERADEFIGDLHEFALKFALSNGSYLNEDYDMISLIGIAAKGAGISGQISSAKTLWELFLVYEDSYSRVEILGALSVLGKNNQEIIDNINKFLESENVAFLRGTSPQANLRLAGAGGGIRSSIQESRDDYPVIRAAIAALGVIGNSSSFPYLFSTMTLDYPQPVIQETLKALESINGNYKDYLISIIKRNPANEKAAAFRIGVYNQKLISSDRGEIAQAALEASLESFGPLETSLRYDAITVLTRLGWSPAAPLVIRNFYRVQSDYMGGLVPKDRLIEAIACLGAMGSSEPAKVLALHLGYFNSETEKTGKYDEDIILAIIKALGDLGDKAAFDYLLYIEYLSYPDKIQTQARDALSRLKW